VGFDRYPDRSVVGSDLINVVRLAREAADPMNDPNSVVEALSVRPGRLGVGRPTVYGI
jgi:hypothetical protein